MMTFSFVRVMMTREPGWSNELAQLDLIKRKETDIYGSALFFLNATQS